MAFLALDTSTEYLSLAIYHQGQIHSLDIHVGQTHAEVLIDTLRRFLQTHQLSMEHVQGIAYGQGPGSFTGLRIACAVAQGLAFAKNIPLIGISNLQALALQSTGTHIISCIDARMGEVYLAMYQLQEGNFTSLFPPTLCAPDNLPDLPCRTPEIMWSGIGNGLRLYQQAFITRYPLVAINDEAFVRAHDILILALPQFHAHLGLRADQAGLVYLRDKVALTTAERENKQ